MPDALLHQVWRFSTNYSLKYLSHCIVSSVLYIFWRVQRSGSFFSLKVLPALSELNIIPCLFMAAVEIADLSGSCHKFGIGLIYFISLTCCRAWQYYSIRYAFCENANDKCYSEEKTVMYIPQKEGQWDILLWRLLSTNDTRSAIRKSMIRSSTTVLSEWEFPHIVILILVGEITSSDKLYEVPDVFCFVLIDAYGKLRTVSVVIWYSYLSISDVLSGLIPTRELKRSISFRLAWLRPLLYRSRTTRARSMLLYVFRLGTRYHRWHVFIPSPMSVLLSIFSPIQFSFSKLMCFSFPSRSP